MLPLFLYLKNMFTLIIPIYKRHELTQIVLDYYREMHNKYSFIIIVAGSEGQISKDLAHGLNYIEVENEPLTMKFNALMNKAKDFNLPVLLLGSDDFICENTIINYIELSKKDIDFVYQSNNLYFYNQEKNEFFKYETTNFGAGRYFPLSVLNRIDWNGWKKYKNKGCDAENVRVLSSNGIEIKFFNPDNRVLIDVKYKYNVTNHSILNIMTRAKNPAKRNTPLAKALDKVAKLPKPTEEEKNKLTEPTKGELKRLVKFRYNENALYFDTTEVVEMEINKAKSYVAKGWGEICE